MPTHHHARQAGNIISHTEAPSRRTDGSQTAPTNGEEVVRTIRTPQTWEEWKQQLGGKLAHRLRDTVSRAERL